MMSLILVSTPPPSNTKSLGMRSDPRLRFLNNICIRYSRLKLPVVICIRLLVLLARHLLA